LTGNTGPQGAATIAIGSVTTGAAGSQAQVTRTGTAQDAILNFVVPRGNVGAAGVINTVNAGSGLSGGGSSATVTLSLTTPVTVVNGGTAATSLAPAVVAGNVLVNSGSNSGPVAACSQWYIPAGSANTHGLVGRYATTTANQAPWVTCVRSRGTIASPATIQNGDGIGSFAVGGYYGSGTNFSYQQAGMYGQATQNWASGSRGCQLVFQTTANGSNAMRTVAIMQQDAGTTFSSNIATNGGNLNVQQPASNNAVVFHTVSGVRTWATLTSPNGGFYIQDQSWGWRLYFEAGGVLYVNSHVSPGVDAGYWSGYPNGWYAVQSYNFVQLSGENLKRDITPAPSCLDKITKLCPMEYRLKVDGARGLKHTGFIAGHVREVMGENFGGYFRDRRSGREAISYSDLVATLWRGTQELVELNSRLEAKVAALEAARG
jgi:hypothetical protein